MGSLSEDQEKAEKLHRAVYILARRKSAELYHLAHTRGIINSAQADAMLELWDERHPYQPLDHQVEEAAVEAYLEDRAIEQEEASRDA